MTINILKNKRIAVVEDNIVNLAVFATALKKQGARVIQDNWSTNPITVLLDNGPIDLILLDLMLRYGNTGYEVFDQIQLVPELKDIPIVAISSLDPATEIPKLQEKGFSGFISKPIRVFEFPQLLADVLNGENVCTTGR